MSRKVLIFLCFVATTAWGCTTRNLPVPPPDRDVALSNATTAIANWEQSKVPEEVRDASSLRQASQELTSVLASSPEEQRDLPVRYNLGEMEALIIEKTHMESKPVDRAMGEDALRNLNMLIANKSVDPAFIMNANYFAGNTSYAMEGATTRTQGYWQSCAKQGHPGCANSLASLVLEKPSPTDDDFRQALEMNTQVANTGIAAHCAGLYSANVIAEINHFTGIKRPGDDEIKWMETAKALWRELQRIDNISNACDGAGLDLQEYMMLLDRGEKRDDLLDEASQTTNAPFDLYIVKFLRGNLSEDSFIKATAGGYPDTECLAHFFALWNAKQHRQMEIARKHYDVMKALPSNACQVTFVRRFLAI